MSTLPKIVADLTLQLAVKIAIGGTTGTLSSNVDDDGVTLPDGLFYFTFDGNNAQREHVSCTKTGTALTAIKTVSRQAVETLGVLREHRVGATVVMTDFATYKAYVDNTATSGAPDASASTKGIAMLSCVPASTPIAVGTNDPRVPTADPTTLFAPIAQSGILSGMISPYAGRVAPAGFLMCDGSAISRTTYSALFAIIVPNGVATISIANPGVVTKTAHGLATGDVVHFTTTGLFPTGIATNTNYYVSVKDANSFWLFDTKAHAFADAGAGSGTGIVVTTGTQSGVHTVYSSSYGKGDGATTFNLPDLRGLIPYGQKTGDANFDTLNSPNTYVGEKTHILTATELASHTHNLSAPNDIPHDASGWASAGGGGYSRQTDTGSVGDGPHNNMPPYAVFNYIIKT